MDMQCALSSPALSLVNLLAPPPTPTTPTFEQAFNTLSLDDLLAPPPTPTTPTFEQGFDTPSASQTPTSSPTIHCQELMQERWSNIPEYTGYRRFISGYCPEDPNDDILKSSLRPDDARQCYVSPVDRHTPYLPRTLPLAPVPPSFIPTHLRGVPAYRTGCAVLEKALQPGTRIPADQGRDRGMILYPIETDESFEYLLCVHGEDHFFIVQARRSYNMGRSWLSLDYEAESIAEHHERPGWFRRALSCLRIKSPKSAYVTGAGGGAEESVEAVPIARQDRQASAGGGGMSFYEGQLVLVRDKQNPFWPGIVKKTNSKGGLSVEILWGDDDYTITVAPVAQVIRGLTADELQKLLRMKAKNKVQKDKRRDLLRAQEIFLKMNGPTKIDGQVKADIANKNSGNGAFIVEGNAGNNTANDNDQSKSAVGKEAKAQVDRNAGVEQAVRSVTFGQAGDTATGEEEIFAAVVAGDNSQADADQSLNAPSAKAGVSFKTLPAAISEDHREVNSQKKSSPGHINRPKGEEKPNLRSAQKIHPVTEVRHPKKRKIPTLDLSNPHVAFFHKRIQARGDLAEFERCRVYDAHFQPKEEVTVVDKFLLALADEIDTTRYSGRKMNTQERYNLIGRQSSWISKARARISGEDSKLGGQSSTRKRYDIGIRRKSTTKDDKSQPESEDDDLKDK
ncbi:hypothetical protein F5877DRAFT_85553 [Lentinula edodes]|nr:hypothetical protein F5877DRAFT_85553 [Lentinula edodes]